MCVCFTFDTKPTRETRPMNRENSPERHVINHWKVKTTRCRVSGAVDEQCKAVTIISHSLNGSTDVRWCEMMWNALDWSDQRSRATPGAARVLTGLWAVGSDQHQPELTDSTEIWCCLCLSSWIKIAYMKRCHLWVNVFGQWWWLITCQAFTILS